MGKMPIATEDTVYLNKQMTFAVFQEIEWESYVL